MSAKFVGAYLAIPAGDKPLLAKVIFASSYFRNVIALKLFVGSSAEEPLDFTKVEGMPFEVHYTGAQPIRSKRWNLVGKGDVTNLERELTRRTAGGEIWIEDNHLGPAIDADLRKLPEMSVKGATLIEKYAANLSSPQI